MGDNFSMDCGRGWCWGDSDALHLLCTLFLLLFVIYNEIIIQLIIMQNPWEPWACFPATIWFYLGVMGDSDTQSVILMSSLLHHLIFIAVTAEKPASQRWGIKNGSRLSSAFAAISGHSSSTLIHNGWRFQVVSNILLRALSFAVSSHWSSYSMNKVDSAGLFTNGSWIHSFPVWGAFVVGK